MGMAAVCPPIPRWTWPIACPMQAIAGPRAGVASGRAPPGNWMRRRSGPGGGKRGTRTLTRRPFVLVVIDWRSSSAVSPKRTSRKENHNGFHRPQHRRTLRMFSQLCDEESDSGIHRLLCPRPLVFTHRAGIESGAIRTEFALGLQIPQALQNLGRHGQFVVVEAGRPNMEAETG